MTDKQHHPVRSLRRALIGGTIWMVAARWGGRLIGMVSTIILARLLVPEDFGLVAMAMIVVGLVEVLFAYGVDTALIQNPRAGKDHFDTAWTIRIIQGGLVTGLLFLVAPLASAYFKEPRVADVLRVLCVAIVVNSVSNVGVIQFRKDLNFSKEFQFAMIGRVINFVATIGMAFALRNFWALVLGQLIGSVLGCIQSYVMHPYRPRLSVKAAREIWSFSQWMLLVNISNYALGKVDEIVVGGQGNGTIMGIYSVSSEVAELPTTELAFPLARALLPGYALLKDDPGRLNQAFLNVLGFVSTVTVPAALGLAMLAEHLVPILLGNKWIDTIPLIQCLAIFGAIRTIYGGAGNLLVVLGRTKLLAALTWFQVALTIGATLAGIHAFGLIGVALAKLAVVPVFFLVLFYTVVRVSSITRREIGARIWRPSVAGLAMVVTLECFARVAPSNPLSAIAVSTVIGALVYSAAILLLWQSSGRPAGTESFLLDVAAQRLKRGARS